MVCLSYTCVFGETKRTKRIRINNKSCVRAPFLVHSLSLYTHFYSVYLFIGAVGEYLRAARTIGRGVREQRLWSLTTGVLGHEWLMIPTRVNAQLAWIDHSYLGARPVFRVDVSMRINALTIRRALVCVCVAGPQTDTKRQIYIWMDTSGDEAYDILLWTWKHPLLGISKRY